MSRAISLSSSSICGLSASWAVTTKSLATSSTRLHRAKLKRLIVCLPPRHSKSEFASTYFPCLDDGAARVISRSFKPRTRLSWRLDSAGKVRNIIDSDDYSQVFPDLQLQADNKSAGRWTTNQEGESFYAGVGGAITGRGADL